MPSKDKNQAGNLSFSSCLVVVVVLILISLVAGSSLAFAQEDLASVRQAQVLESDDLGLANPAGLAYSPAANALLVVEAPELGGPSALFTGIKVITPLEGRVGTVHLLVAVADPLNMAFDGQANRLLLYQPATRELIEVGAGPDGHLNPAMVTRHDAWHFGLERPQGMAVDPANGQLFFLDSAGPRIVSVEPDLEGGFGDAVVMRVDLDQTGLWGLRGLAFDPTTGHLYVLAPAQQMLYELTAAGDLVSTRDLSPFALGNPQGMVFAPSGDSTDDPSRMSLYIADSGLGGGQDRQATWQPSGQIVELSFDQLEPQVPMDTAATLVQVIDTSLFDPPSPDPAGITYLESSGTLLEADSEVNETIYWEGSNLFEFTLDGSLVGTSTTSPHFSDEPTGVVIDPASGHLFFSDDGRKKVWVVDLGANGVYDPDDDRTSFDTLAYGSGDPEGITFDPWQGVLFIVDGVNAEVYRVDPGPNGLFDGVGVDDVVTSWDTLSFGVRQGEGITYDARDGSLYLIGKPKDSLAHVTTSGTLLRMIDLSEAVAAGLSRPAGLTLAPDSRDGDGMNIYLAARMVDNQTDPLENDGKVFELYIPPYTGGSGVSLIPAGGALSADPGTDVVYNLSVVNEGSVPDTFNLTVSGHTWPTDVSPSVVSVAPGELASVDVTVTVPEDAVCGDDVATVTATSQSDGAISDSSVLTTMANAVYEVRAVPSSSAASGDPGSNAFHSLHVTNRGNCVDTFDVAVSDETWTTYAPSPVGPLAPGASTDVEVRVSVPQGAQCGDDDSGTITFTSQGDPSKIDSSNLTTTANTVRSVTIIPPSGSASADPGYEVVYSLWVQNSGNCIDVFDLDVDGATWPVEVQPTVGPLAPGAGASIDVTVTVPGDALCGDDVATVTATSQADGTASDSSVLTTTANAVYGVTVTPPSDAASGDPGDDVVYVLRVTNTGNCRSKYDITIDDNTWPTESRLTVGPLAPGAGSNRDVTVTVPQGARCGEGDSATVTVTSQNDVMASDSSILNTSANAVYGATVEPHSHTASGDPGTDVIHALRVTNSGNCEDTYNISVSGDIWPTEAPDTVGPLAPDQDADVDVTVGVRLCTTGGDSDAITVASTSQHDGTESDSAALTTRANQVPPVANDDEYDALEDTPLVVEAPGVLGNDSDLNCDERSVSWYTQPDNGTVLLQPDGSFVYTPDTNFVGEDSFTYRAFDGDLTDTATVTITVLSGGDDPIVQAGDDQSADEGEPVQFDGGFDDPARTLAAGETIDWDFGDGETTTGTLTPSHAYDDNGEYVVTLTVTDSEGDVGHDSLVVTVDNVAPLVDAGPDQHALRGELISFSGSFTDVGLDDTHTIEWDLGNGTIIQDTLTFDYAYEDIGIYTVTLTVTDDDGGVGTDTVEIAVMRQTYLPFVLRALHQ